MRPAHRARQVLNAVNLSTPLGLLLAAGARASVSRGPDGLLLARGYRLRVPPAPAFTLGNVVLMRSADPGPTRAGLLAHEGRHATQYAWCLGPAMVPLYLAAAGWSWVRTHDFASRNIFERLAGLAEGGYVERPPRRWPVERRRDT